MNINVSDYFSQKKDYEEYIIINSKENYDYLKEEIKEEIKENYNKITKEIIERYDDLFNYLFEEYKNFKEKYNKLEKEYNELKYNFSILLKSSKKDYYEWKEKYNKLNNNYDKLLKTSSEEYNKLSYFLEKNIKEHNKLKEENKKYKYVINENDYENKEYIYVIQEREFIRLKEYTFKIGRTSHYDKRFKQYSKGSKLMFLMYCKKSKIAEKKIIQELKKAEGIAHMENYGNEYFKGDLLKIIKYITDIILTTSYTIK